MKVDFNFYTYLFKLTSLSIKYQICTIIYQRKKVLSSTELGPVIQISQTLLVKVSLKFQMLIFEIRQYFLFKQRYEFCIAKASLIFFNKIYQCIWL